MAYQSPQPISDAKLRELFFSRVVRTAPFLTLPTPTSDDEVKAAWALLMMKTDTNTPTPEATREPTADYAVSPHLKR